MASTSTSLGKRLRSRRVALGLTLADASARAGLSLPYVSNLERGRGNPTIDALRSLADALDLEVGELVGGDGSGEALDTSSLVLADAPPSLGEFTRSGRFEAVARRLAVHQAVSYTHLRAHETVLDLVCRLLLEKNKHTHTTHTQHTHTHSATARHSPGDNTDLRKSGYTV